MRAPHNTTTVFAQPVSVASRLRESFFGKMNSAVVTSATLTAENSFHFILNELGLDEGECRTVKIPAPFMYRKQVKMIVPDDLPEVNAVSSAEYVSSICQHIVSVAEAVQGRILIFFTSREMLKQTYDWIAESGLLADYALIAQDVSNGSRNRLLKKFLRFEGNPVWDQQFLGRNRHSRRKAVLSHHGQIAFFPSYRSANGSEKRMDLPERGKFIFGIIPCRKPLSALNKGWAGCCGRKGNGEWR